MSEYREGIDMNQFKVIESLSRYNYNYHQGLNKDILLAESDDDNRTEWYVCDNACRFYIGHSLTNEGDILRK